MKNHETGVIQLELKYCERCGGLGLRPQGSDLLFCAACSRMLAGLAPSSNLTTHVLHFPRPAADSSKTWSEGGKA
jgi:hypothetical protein